ncbi:MAG TPA: sterol desaturase family protein [Leptospiraceae bacterium]|nr:sterol desaturase family protein [Leptospiraceae bacterium]
MLESFKDAILYLGAVSLVFIPLEKAFSVQERPVFRAEFFTDLVFYLGQILVWNELTVSVLRFLFAQERWKFISPFQERVSLLPFWAVLFLTVFFSDLFIYWGHRLQHRISFLWKFHRVHHTALSLDYIAAYREHPLDNIYTRGLETLPAVILGLDLNSISGFIVFRGLFGLFIHSNTNLRFGFLEKLIGSPHLHHWHHEIEKGGNCNFANLSPLMDILFGTYYSPQENASVFGIRENIGRGYFEQILESFRFSSK